jgi:GTP-binding protein Era
VSGAWAAASDCDALLFIVDAHRQMTKPDPRIPNLLASARDHLEALKHTAETGLQIPPSVLALNKVDLLEGKDRDRLKVLARQLAGIHPFEKLFPISAKKGKGTQTLMDYFLTQAPLRPWDLPPDQATDRSQIDQVRRTGDPVGLERLSPFGAAPAAAAVPLSPISSHPTYAGTLWVARALAISRWRRL